MSKHQPPKPMPGLSTRAQALLKPRPNQIVLTAKGQADKTRSIVKGRNLMSCIPQDAYTFLCRFARRHKRKAWSPEQAIGQAATVGIEFGDARRWGPVFQRVSRDGYIKRAGMFARASSNRSVRPGWIGVA